MLQATRYVPNHPELRTTVDFIWSLTSDGFETIDHKLLPVINTDLIINLSSPIYYYRSDGIRKPADNVHLRHVKTKAHYVFQEGVIHVWGVAFFPFGIYPFIDVPLDKLEGQVVSLHEYDSAFTGALLQRLKACRSSEDHVNAIENSLLQQMRQKIDLKTMDILTDFTANMAVETIHDFCDKRGINIRWLERTVKKYVGVSPKTLQNIGRFQQAGNHLIYDLPMPALTGLTYSYDYFDQTHFSKEFKRYSGTNPTAFIRDSNTVKKLIK